MDSSRRIRRGLLLLSLLSCAMLASGAGPQITAKLTDNTASAVHSGDTISYGATVANTGDADATAVVFSDTLDQNTALAAGTIRVSPIAFADSYPNVPGNTRWTADPATGLLANDRDPDASPALSNAGLEVKPGSVQRTGGTITGTLDVTLADGSFTYDPPEGQTGDETFSYIVRDAHNQQSSPSTITFVVKTVVWYVDSNAPGGGNGTRLSPFNSLTPVNGAGGAGDVDAAGHIIYVAAGAGPYLTGLELESNQQLIGAGVALVVDGQTIYPAGTAPTLTRAAGHCLSIASNNTLRGLILGNTEAASSAIASSGPFGTLTIANTTINGTGGILNLGHSGTLAAAFDSLASTSSSGTAAIRMNTVGGSLTSTAGTVILGAASGIDIQNAPAGASFSFGAASLESSGTAVALASNASASTAFASLAITTSVGTGLLASSGGTVQIAGVGNTISAAGGPAVNLTSTSLGAGATFSACSSSGSPATGLNLDGVSGSFTANGGSIATATGNALDINAGSANVTYAGSITNTASRAVEVTSRTGGTVTISGAIIDSGSGINVASNSGGAAIDFSNASKSLNTGANPAVTLSSNTGATINFTGGGLDIDTTTGTGFNATGGGTVTVQGAGNRIAASAGPGLNISNTLIGSGGATFASIASSGAANGIVLLNSGLANAFAVTGDGALSDGLLARNDSGGTISSTGVAVSLSNAHHVTLRQMDLDSSGGDLLQTTGGSDLTFSALDCGGGGGGDGWQATNLTGANRLDHNSLFSGFGTSGHGVRLINTNTNLTGLTIDQCRFAANDGDAIHVEAIGTSQMTLNVTDENTANAVSMDFDNAGASAIDVLVGVNFGAAQGRVNVSDAVFRNASGARQNNLRLVAEESGKLSFDLDGNTFQAQHATSAFEGNIYLYATSSGVLGPTSGSNGLIRNNTFIDWGPAPAIFVQPRGSSNSSHNVIIQDNTITGGTGNALYVQPSGNQQVCDMRVTGNTFGTLASPNFGRVYIVTSAIGSDTFNLEYTGNDVVSSNTGGYAFLAATGATANLTILGNTFCSTERADRAMSVEAQTSYPSVLRLNFSGNDALGEDGASGGGRFILSGWEFYVQQASNAALLAANTGTFSVGGVDAYNTPCPAPSLLTASLPAPHPHGRRLAPETLAAFAVAAQPRWPGGAVPEMSLQDLADQGLAAEFAGQIRLDPDAAGWGWFVDASPSEDTEFALLRRQALDPARWFGLDFALKPASELVAEPGSPAYGKIDLLTAVLHELGHTIGLDHVSPSHLMAENLPTGVRRLPDGVRPEKGSGPFSGVQSSGLATMPVQPERAPDTVVVDELTEARPVVAGLAADLFKMAWQRYAALPSAVRFNRAPAAPRIMAPVDVVVSGSPQTMTIDLGTLPPGQSVAITYDVTVASPLNAAATQINNQATVSGGNFAHVLSDDPDVGGTSDITTTLVELLADLAVTQSDSPDPVIAGEHVSYTIDFQNNGPDAADTVTVTDALPAHTTFVSATAPGGWSTVAPAVGGTGNVVFSKAAVAGAETAQFTIVVKVDDTTTSNLSNTATAASESTDPTPGNNAATETTTVDTECDLAVTMADSPDPVIASQIVTYTIDLSNAGPSAAQTVSVTDPLPAAATFVSATAPGGWSATTPAVGAGGTVTFSKATVGASETAQFTILATVDPSVADATVLSNTATATTASDDDTPGNDAARATTTVNAAADLAVTQSESPDPVLAGATLTYTIDYVNNGPSKAQDLTVTDAVPANCTFVSAEAPAGWTAIIPGVGTLGNVVFKKITSVAGDTAQFTLVVKVGAATPAATVITNTVTAASATSDPTPDNDSAIATSTVQREADLVLTLSDTSGLGLVFSGDTLSYSVMLTNHGPSDALDVTLTDSLPAGVVFFSQSQSSGPPFTLTNTGDDIVNTIASLPAGSLAIFEFMAQAQLTGTVINTATAVSASTADPTPADATASLPEMIIRAGPIYPATCGFTANKTIATANGVDQATFTVTARDAFGNVVPGVTANEFQFAGTPSAGLSFTQPDDVTDGGGQITATVTRTEPGDVDFTLTHRGIAVPGTATVTWQSGEPRADLSTVTVDKSTAAANGAELVTFTITLRDAQNNPVPNVDHTTIGVSVDDGSGVVLVQPATDTGLDGQTTATATSTVAASKRFSFFAGAINLDQRHDVVFTPGAPVAANSLFVADKTSAVADGVDPVTFTVTARDAFNNPVAFADATDFQVAGAPGNGLLLTQPSGTVDAAGQATATARRTAIGEVDFTLTHSGNPVPGSATVSWNAGQPDAHQSTLAVNPSTATADGLDTVTFTLTLRDSNGTPLPNLGHASIGLAVDDGSGVTLVQPATDSDLNGQTTATATSTVAASKRFSAFAGGINLAQRQDIVFTPGAPSAAHSGFVASPLTLAADGVAQTILTFTIRDAQGNPVPGVAANRLLIEAPGTASNLTLNQVAAPTDAAGQATASASTSTAQSIDFVGQLDGLGVATPQTVRFTAGAADPATSVATVPNVTAGTPAILELQVNDALGNPRPPGDTVVVTITGANPDTPAVTDVGGGLYRATHGTELAGDDVVAITLNGVAVAGSPFTSVVAPGALSVLHSTAVVPNGTAGLPTTISVQARDQLGNPVRTGGASVRFEAVGIGYPMTDHGDGTYSGQYTPTVAGTDRIEISMFGSSLGGGPYDSIVSPGAVDASHSTAIVPNGQAGAATSISIQARDSFDNPRTTGGGTVVVGVTGANSARPPVTDNGDGTYTASYTPSNTGTDQVAIGLGGTLIAGSPFTSQVGSAAADAAHSLATVPHGMAGAVTTVGIQVRDSLDNNRTTGGDTVAINVSGANTATPTVADHGDGTYTATYTPTVTGTDNVAVTIGGAPVAGSPFSSQVAPAAASAAQSTAIFPNGVAGVALTLSIQAKDSFGNLRPTGGDTFVVSITGANTANPVVTDHGDGTYSTVYTPTVAGADQAAITLNGDALTGSPLNATIAPAATDPAKTQVTIPTATAGAPLNIGLVVRDAFGNRRPSGGDTVVVQASGANTATAAIADLGDGSYTASYTPTVAGQDSLAVGVNNVLVPGSPFAVTVQPGAIDAAASTVALDRDLAAADGAAVIRATITLRDALNNPIPNVAADRFSVTGDPAGLSVAGPTAGDGDGQSTVDLSSTTPHEYTLTVRVDALPLAVQPRLTFRSSFQAVLPAGLNFFALPFRPDAPRPEQVLGAAPLDRLAALDPATGTLLRYTPGSTSPLFDLTAGRGFWSDFPAPAPVDVLGDAVPEEPFDFALTTGWNSLGNPFNHSLRWDPSRIEVRQNGALLGLLSNPELWGKVRPFVWIWDTEFRAYWLVVETFGRPTVPPLAGFYLLADEPGLSLRVAADDPGRAAARPVDARRWQVQLQAAAADSPAVGLTVGVDPSLARALEFETPPAPQPATAVRLEVLSGETRLAGELRPAGREQIWELLLTSAVDGNATLSWPSLLRDVPRGLVIELEDPTSGQRWLLNTAASVNLPVTRGGQRRLRLHARFGNLQRSTITGLQLRGSRSGGQTVELNLTAPAEVTLLVKGLAGRLVKSITAQATAAGPLQLTWDGSDLTGRPVPRGNYLLEAIAVSPNGATMRVTRTVTVR